MVAVQLDDSRPTYQQVADVLREDIKSGQLPAGARLPSVRDLSERFNIASGTVQSGLRVLRDEGYVVSRSTRGYFVRDELPPSDGDVPSPEFLAIRDQLDAVTSALHALGERVSSLEAVVQQADESS